MKHVCCIALWDDIITVWDDIISEACDWLIESLGLTSLRCWLTSCLKVMIGCVTEWTLLLKSNTKYYISKCGILCSKCK